MFLPIRSDRRLKHTPWVNYALIAANVIIFLLTKGQVAQLAQYAPHHPFASYADLVHKFPVYAYYLHPVNSQLYQFITYQFLHAGWMHIIGNMIFLFVFGGAVEDRLGKIAYPFFYLSGGVIAGIGHSLIVSSPVLGASGAIAAVTGAYLALFPLSNITVVLWLFLIIPLEIPSIIVILFEVGLNAYSQFSGSGHVAYLAHLFGYAYGFVIGMTLLLTGLLAREPYDLLTMIEHRRRRSRFRRLSKGGYQPWEGQLGGDSGNPAPPSAEEQRIMQLRHEIAASINQHDLSAAAVQYRDLLELSPTQVMSRQAQLDIANQFMSQSDYESAARAYELFLKVYTAYGDKQQIQLILGLIYARYLHQDDRARELLHQAADRLTGGDLELTRQILGELGEKA